MRASIAARHRLRVKQRRRIVEYAREHGIKPAGRLFGLDRRTIRAWLRRWKVSGDEGLVPRYPARRKRRVPDTTRELIRIARVDHRCAPHARRSG
jgi:transposase